MRKDISCDRGTIVDDWVPDKSADEAERLKALQYEQRVRENRIRFFQSWNARYANALRNSPITGPHQR